jgi:hypothetical protein
MVEMRYQYKEEFVEESGRTNVVIAAYTTTSIYRFRSDTTQANRWLPASF